MMPSLRKRRVTPSAAALFVVLGCVASTAQAQYNWLRQTGNSNPNGDGFYQAGGAATGGGAFLGFRFHNSTSVPLLLDHGSMGVASYQAYGLKTSGIYANAWSESAFVGGAPLGTGDLVGRVSVPQPAITLVGQGSFFGEPLNNYTASWDTPGSLQFLNFVVQPGQTAYFAVLVDNQSNQSGHWFARESQVIELSDTLWTGTLGYVPFSSVSWTEHSGYVEGDWAFVAIPAPATVTLLFGTGLFACRRRRS